MGGDIESADRAEARSALGWWLEAGVDLAIQEEARDWLRPAAKSVVPRPVQTPSVGNVSEPSAETLSELQQWLASSVQLPLASASSRRILPHGPEDAAIMLLSDAPALEDFTAGQPIGGVSWELTKRMLAAIGTRPEDAYSASLSCFHSPGMRMSDEEREACAQIARNQIRLVKPGRLILFGDGACKAMLGKSLVEARGHVHHIEGVRTIATFHPRQLVKNPANKTYAWKDLLLLMEDQS